MAESSRKRKNSDGGKKGKELMMMEKVAENQNRTTRVRKFLTPDVSKSFNSIWSKRSLHMEHKVKLTDFAEFYWYEVVVSRGWENICTPHDRVNATIVQEFYANLKVDGDTTSAYVRGKMFDFNASEISRILGLGDLVDNPTYRFSNFGDDNDTPWADWAGVILFLTGQESRHLLKKKNVPYNELLLQYKVLAHLVARNILPNTHVSELSHVMSYMVYTIGNDVNFCLASTIYDHVAGVAIAKEEKKVLPFPCLICKMCKDAGISDEIGDYVGRMMVALDTSWFEKSEAQYRAKHGSAVPMEEGVYNIKTHLQQIEDRLIECGTMQVVMDKKITAMHDKRHQEILLGKKWSISGIRSSKSGKEWCLSTLGLENLLMDRMLISS